MYQSHQDSGISYFFSGEFYAYRSLFEEFCPPPMKIEKGMRICRHGHTKNWMYYLCKGSLKVYVENLTGNERIVALLGEDTIAGLDCFLPGTASLMTIESTSDCWLMPFLNTTLEAMMQKSPEFSIELVRYYCKVMRQLCFDATNQSVSSVFIRLANFLQVNWDDQDNNRVLLSQQDLAAAVNCSRTSIARVCKLMKEEGVISVEGIGFRILDFSNLEALCRKYAHL